MVFFSMVAGGRANYDPDSVFTRANIAYSENDFDRAIPLYKSIIDNGYESAELYFNLGNAWYRSRNYPRAILNYERALLLDPMNENILHNLEKARLYNVDKIDEIPEIIIQRGIKQVVGMLRSNTWAIFSMALFIAGLILLMVYFMSLKIQLKRIGFYTGVILLIFSLLSFGLAAKAKKMQLESKGAIVLTPSVTVKGSPAIGGTDLFIIHEGTKVFIQDSINDWYEIKLSDGKQGWLPQADIEVI